MILKIKDEEGRLDVVLSNYLNESRSKIQKKIKAGTVLVNNRPTTSHYLVQKDDEVLLKEEEKTEKEIKPLESSLEIVFENENLIILNKPSGLVVHPAPGHIEDTLVNILVSKYNFSNMDSKRPGIVHRLDKDTSGLMLVAKTEKAEEKLSEMLKNKEVKRYYLALVDGVILNDSGTIDAPIGRDPNNRLKMMVTAKNSKAAITHFKVLKRFKKHTLVECQLETGRTHQIRVHFAYINHPVTNDPVYNHHKKSTSYGQMLHSYKIELIEPFTKEKLNFTCLPDDSFNFIIEGCENE